MKINLHVKKLLQRIHQACQEYTDNKIDIPQLQGYVSAIHSNFEGDVPERIKKATFIFVEELEEILFMVDSNDQSKEVLSQISTLESILAEYEDD